MTNFNKDDILFKKSKSQSAFLWGARKTRKTTYLKEKFPITLYFDFLKTDLFFKVIKNPSILGEWLWAKDENAIKEPIILNEVQKTLRLRFF